MVPDRGTGRMHRSRGDALPVGKHKPCNLDLLEASMVI